MVREGPISGGLKRVCLVEEALDHQVGFLPAMKL